MLYQDLCRQARIDINNKDLFVLFCFVILSLSGVRSILLLRDLYLMKDWVSHFLLKKKERKLKARGAGLGACETVFLKYI